MEMIDVNKSQSFSVCVCVCVCVCVYISYRGTHPCIQRAGCVLKLHKYCIQDTARHSQSTEESHISTFLISTNGCMPSRTGSRFITRIEENTVTELGPTFVLLQS